MKKTFTLALSLWFGSLFSQVQTYTVPGTYSFTVPASVTTLTLEVVGAGGSGGGNGGGGGGGGGYAKGIYTVTPGAVLSVNVGTGGGGAGSGTSNVGSLISATGGANGVSVANPTIGGGGAGGLGSGGTIANYTGGTGGGGYWTYFGGGGAGAAGSVSNGTNGGNTIAWTGVCQTPGGSAGTGGGTPGGNGGKGAGFTDSGCNVSDPSASGANFGGGGGGGNGNGGGPGTGAGGYCQISWLGCTPPVAPTNATSASNQTICATPSTTLMATGTGTLNWYASPTSTMSLATGTAYATSTLSAGSYTYYAASTNTCSEGPRTAITVSVNPLPVITANTGTVCSQSSFTFVPTGASTYTYVAGGTNVKTPVIPSSIPSATVTYVINGTSAEGCIGTGSLSVVVYSRPTLTVTSSPTLICVGQSATLTASGADTYQWTSFNGTFTTAVAVVSPTTGTTYVATGRRSSTGCSDLTSLFLSVAPCTGIQNLAANEPVLSIYPNPSKGDFTIASDREINLSLVNNLGQVVKTLSINTSNNYKAEVSNLANGIYSIIGDDGRQAIKQKIVVAK